MATDAKETQKQENGSKLAFEFAIEQNKFPQVLDFEKVYPNMPAYWMDIYKAQSKAIKNYLANKRGYNYSRDTGIMPFMEQLASKKMGVSVKDRWNPMDIVMVSRAKEVDIKKNMQFIADGKEKPDDKLIKLNLYMKDLLKNKDLIPISLKALKKGATTALLEEANLEKKSKGVIFKLKQGSIKCDLDMVKPPLIDTGELSFSFFVDDEQVKVQIRSKRYSKAATGPQIILAPVGRASGALLGSASTEAIDLFLRPLNLQRPPSPSKDTQVDVNGKFSKSQIEFWSKLFDRIRNVTIDGSKIDYDAPLDLGSKTNVNFKEILEYGLQYKDSNRNTLGRITSKLFCLRYIEVFNSISKRGMWSEFLSCLYYGAKKEFGDKNGPFIKIY
jgi:hypothetical protein